MTKLSISHNISGLDTLIDRVFESTILDGPIWRYPYDLSHPYSYPTNTIWHILPGLSATSFTENRRDDILELSLDVPGIKPENVSVDVKDNRIYVSASCKERNRHYNATYAIPAEYDGTTIEAEMEYGILTLRLSKRKEVISRKIPIKSR